MADFRKWLLVIAVVLVTAVSASAQSSIKNIPCGTTAQVPNLRTGGVTEYIGEVDLSCDASQTGLNGGLPVIFQLSLTLNAIVTNATGSNGIDNLGPLTMSAAVVQLQQNPQTILQTVQGRVFGPAGQPSNVLKFPGVYLPLGTTFTIKFINVRVAAVASTLIGTVQNPFNLTQVYGMANQDGVNPTGWSLSINGEGAEGILVGSFAPTMSFALTDCTGKPTTANISFQQCIDYSLDNNDPGSRITPFYGVTFTELTNTAFKNIVEEDGSTQPVAGDPVGTAGYAGDYVVNPGPQICDTAHDASGDAGNKVRGILAPIDDVPPIPPCPDQPAWISNGTRLMARFTVLQPLIGKIKIWVTRYQTASPENTQAELVSVTDPLGIADDNFKWEGPDVNCTADGGNRENSWMLLNEDGSGVETATWELTSDDIGNLEQITFGWAITYKEMQLPSLPDVNGVAQAYPAITLAGNMGPVDASKVLMAQSLWSEPVVRFIPVWTGANVKITLDHCVTDLLFPYVTNILGYNTGIAISNTSLDSPWNLADVNGNLITSPSQSDPTSGTAANPLPYDTTPQAGPCALWLFGSHSPMPMSGASIYTPAGAHDLDVQVFASGLTPNVAAGQVFADTIANIFNLNGGKTPVTMSGYIIARCQFQFGHGYGYVVSPNAMPQSYLALIIPDRNVLNADTNTGFWHSTPIRIAQPMSNSTYDEQGEQLAQ